MERKFKFCIRCRRTITDRELERGLHVESTRGLLCATCAQILDEAAQHATPEREALKPALKTAKSKPAVDGPTRESADKTVEHLESLKEQVETIQRILLFEKTSVWNVIAGVAQCLAVGMLAMAGMQWLEGGENTGNLLMITIVFQLMALTFFLKAK